MKLWGGRFSGETSEIVKQFGDSFLFDCCLLPYDLRANAAHARMLGHCGILKEEDAEKIASTLEKILLEFEQGKVSPEGPFEDVHSFVEAKLAEDLPSLAGNLRIARSRNDLVAADLRLFLKEAIGQVARAVILLQEVLLCLARDHKDVALPGYTHLQHAQPILLSHHLLAYFQMLNRDLSRFAQALAETDVSPLGAGALGGTSWPIDPEYTAQLLGFSRVFENSLDAVSDRDFVIQFHGAASILAMHLSRFSEELILWSTAEFGFIELADEMCTGSSLMPQKKNPDLPELVRGKSGRVFGNLMGVLTVMKALPLAYNKDLQEDKESLFDTVDTVLGCLDAMRAVLSSVKVNKKRMETNLSPFLVATDLADELVKAGHKFSEAHELVGKMVQYCLDHGKRLTRLSPDELSRFSPNAGSLKPGKLTPRASLARKGSRGSTRMGSVEDGIKNAEVILRKNQKTWES
ncbi:MAG: argininosuccinate lyase [Armatimonadetes bacterium]|nr:argininosuccinate lyase [Armatimonadota bacterium]